MNSYKYITLLFLGALLFSCKSDQKTNTKPAIKKDPVKVPAFDADRAYGYIEKQLSFGTRVPGTPSHEACKNWMVQEMKALGADVIEQDFVANIHNGEKWASTNIIAQYNTHIKDRVILSAHWDTRYKADQDEDPNMVDQPIMGADDGGSGVGVLMAIAKVIQDNPIDLGVDIIFWDAEDQGGEGRETWCLGSQYWSRNKHKKNYRAKYGINLDMVGAKNPLFGQDVWSQKYANDTLQKVWSLAQRMGYSDMFVTKNTGDLTDDHLFVNTIAKIPMIDIINQPDGVRFQKCWHKSCDDLSIIDKRSLRVVGQVVTATIYKESDGTL